MVIKVGFLWTLPSSPRIIGFRKILDSPLVAPSDFLRLSSLDLRLLSALCGSRYSVEEAVTA